jgi:hypothetical protein
MTMTNLEINLQNWLTLTTTQIFERFSTLKIAHRIARGADDTRFLYIQGARADRVLLIAHADTVWDAKEGYPAPVRYENGVYSSQNPTLGIGADDRAGCALVWELRNMGHSLLITSGEEKGCIASHWLADANPDVLAELNAHQFMVQFDRQQATQFKCYEVGTDEFRAYVHTQTGYTEPDRLRGTDIKILAQQICGVNLSVGYYDEHTPNERLAFAEWEHTLNLTKAWLSQNALPKFARG